jgi:hypothetical protein
MKPEYKTHNPVNHGLPPHLEIRHYPSATQDYLSWQIGQIKIRMGKRPIFDSPHRVLDHIRTGTSVSVFHLQSWGTSLERAKEMWFLRDRKEARV